MDWTYLRAKMREHLLSLFDDFIKMKAAAKAAGIDWNAVVQTNILRTQMDYILDRAIVLHRVDALVEVASATLHGGDPGVGNEIRALWEQRPDQAVQIANESTLDAALLWRQRCFINRSDLRRELRALRVQKRRVLVVNGPEDSGKSYSLQLVQHLAAVEKRFRVAYYEHKRNDGPSLSPDRLAEAIVGDELGDLSRAPVWENEGDGGWAKRVCNWMIQRIFAISGAWWLVLDGLDDPGIAEETHLLIGKLATKVARATGNINIEGIVLIQYPEDRIPTEIADDTVIEKVTPIDRPHVESFFRSVFAQRGDDIDDDAIDELVEAVWPPALQATPAERLKTLADSVDRELGRLFPP